MYLPFVTKDVEQADNGEVFDGVTIVYVIAILREPCDIKTFIILLLIVAIRNSFFLESLNPMSVTHDI